MTSFLNVGIRVPDSFTASSFFADPVPSLHCKKFLFGAGEMAEQLSALTALAEDPGSIPSTHVVAKTCLRPGVVLHAFNPSTHSLGRQRQGDFCEFKASLVYRASSRRAGTKGRDPVSKRTLPHLKKFYVHKSIDCVYVHALISCRACRGQKRVSDALGLELQTVVSYPVGTGN